jgi:HlyD family secretion protein
MGVRMANGNGNGHRKRNRRLGLVGVAVVILAVFGVMAARSDGKTLDPSRLATVEKGDLARSVVATGKIQPLTKLAPSRAKVLNVTRKRSTSIGSVRPLKAPEVVPRRASASNERASSRHLR